MKGTENRWLVFLEQDKVQVLKGSIRVHVIGFTRTSRDFIFEQASNLKLTLIEVEHIQTLTMANNQNF